MSTETSPQPAPRTAGWVKVLLTFSVAVNLLILGAAGGFAWKHWQRFGGHGEFDDIPRPIARFVRSLPEEKRAPFRAALRERRQAVQPLRRELREARRGLRDTLEAETFDATAFANAQERFLRALMSIRQTSLNAVPDLAKELTQEERARFARALIRASPRVGGRRRFRDD